MSSFDEFVHQNFDAHLRVVTEAGGMPRRRTRSVVHAIRRRRAVRAGTTTGVSALTVGAVAVGVMNLRPSEDVAPIGNPTPSGSSAPFEFSTPPQGAPAWCDLSAYPGVNPDALGALRYDGRVYSNFVDQVFVYVAPDGSHQALEPDSSGEISVEPPDGGSTISVPTGVPTWTFMAWDFSQGAGGGRDLSDGGDPGLLYEWTTTVPDVVPAGVDIDNLSQQLAIIIGLGGSGFNPYAYPDGAVVESVIRWTDGHERVEKLSATGPGAELVDYAGLASVSVRVSNLPGGEVFEITSTYDPTKTWSAACVAGGSAPSSTRPIVSPTSTPYLEGPESAVFQCLVPLPAESEGVLPTTATLETGQRRVSYAGLASDFDMNGTTVDFGSLGVLVTSSHPVSEFPVSDIGSEPQDPGWTLDGSGTGPDPSDPILGALLFRALAWVDADGVIVGREVQTTDPDGLYVGSGNIDTLGGPSVGDTGLVSYTVSNVDTLGVPCAGVDPGALDSASLVWVEGAGPDLDHMTWSWTRVGPLSDN